MMSRSHRQTDGIDPQRLLSIQCPNSIQIRAFRSIAEAIDSSSRHPSQRYSIVIARAMATAYSAYSSATGGHEQQQQSQLAAFDPPGTWIMKYPPSQEIEGQNQINPLCKLTATSSKVQLSDLDSPGTWIMHIRPGRISKSPTSVSQCITMSSKMRVSSIGT